jgi:molybdate transport repressor ModE-like protein
MLSFERLRILHAVATYGSVNAAASALHVTNSAVSQQIAKLESELGQPLLERNGRGVRLADAAAVLASNAQQMLALMDRAELTVWTVPARPETPVCRCLPPKMALRCIG